MSMRARWGASIGIAISVSLLFASSSSALTRVSADGESIGGGLTSGVAQCPQGKRVISGGFAMSPFSNAFVNRARGKDAWTASAASNSLKIYAYCSGKRQVKVRRDSGAFDPSARADAKARCPKGRVVVSGGWSYSDATSNSPVFRSSPAGTRSWAVSGFSQSGGSLSSYAYCAKKGTERALRTASSSTASLLQTASATAKCKKSEELLGGGFSTSPRPDFFSDAGPDFFFSDSVRLGTRSWRARGPNISNGAGKIKTTAICAK